MLVATDHEEVGSASTVGAQGPMLMDALTALTPALQSNQCSQSIDAIGYTHAVHPNYVDTMISTAPTGGGPVIKINRNQRYATDSRARPDSDYSPSERG